jgi:hypothetical protein
MPGRPSKLTPALEAALVNAVTIGVPLRAATDLVGVAYDTVLRWMQRGEGRHPTRRATAPYVHFVQALKKAQAADQARRIARIEQAARGGDIREEHTRTMHHKDGTTTTVREVRYAAPQWQADAWHLERTDPKHWGRHDRLDVHTVREKIARKARELGETYDLDIDELIERAEGYANGLDDEDLEDRG